ncbi:hypothetical protein E2C01_016446 [Portunus trituberculatus]|uniref:Uncharacterized protein n=1 Tax=Portunus trituberculatus TaxID=210409 RepID=A0A5B7DP27_PORTR|nr:hypothetical protein [Portunus trituberculatus]
MQQEPDADAYSTIRQELPCSPASSARRTLELPGYHSLDVSCCRVPYHTRNSCPSSYVLLIPECCRLGGIKGCSAPKEGSHFPEMQQSVPRLMSPKTVPVSHLRLLVYHRTATPKWSQEMFTFHGCLHTSISSQ